MLDNNRFLIHWDKDKTLVTVIDTNHADYVKLNVDPTNRGEKIRSDAAYVVATMPYAAAEELVVNFLNQRFWSIDMVSAHFSRLYGDAFDDVDQMLTGSKTPRESAVEDTELRAVNYNKEDETELPEPIEYLREFGKPKVKETESLKDLGLNKFKNSINIIAIGGSQVIMGDESVRTVSSAKDEER